MDFLLKYPSIENDQAIENDEAIQRILEEKQMKIILAQYPRKRPTISFVRLSRYRQRDMRDAEQKTETNSPMQTKRT